MSARPAEDELGFAGLLAAGYTPKQAWQMIREQVAEPEVRTIITNLEGTADGRAALAWSRRAWAAHGLPAPWDDLPGPAEPEGDR